MNIWDWSHPLGVGAFILGIALVVLVSTLAQKTLVAVPSGIDRAGNQKQFKSKRRTRFFTTY